MRIIKGHDYYDSALAYGADPSIVFVRDAKTLINNKANKKLLEVFYRESGLSPLKHDNIFEPRDRKKSRFAWRYDAHEIIKGSLTTQIRLISAIVGGKRYNGLRLTEADSKTGTKRSHHIWDFEEFKAVLDDYGYSLKSYSWRSETTTIEEFMTEPKVSEQTYDWLIKNKVAVVVYGPGSIPHDFGTSIQEDVWTINGNNLHLIDFQKVMDAYKCNQEISMWVGGVLPKDGPPMVEITDDKIKAHKHGMDKWSFRRTSAEKPNS